MHPFTLEFYTFRRLIITYILFLLFLSLYDIFIKGFPNNFLIFRFSFFHLLEAENLYRLFPEDHADHFKYSPTFAFLMAPLAVLPKTLGAVIWNLINGMSVLLGLKQLPLTRRQIAIIALFILPEVLNCAHNFQSNTLIVGLSLYTFGRLTRGSFNLAAVFSAFGLHLKIYSGLIAILGLIFHRKIKFAGYFLAWTLIFTLLPIVVHNLSYLMDTYQNWGELILKDADWSYGTSLMGLLHAFTGIQFNPVWLQAGGLLVLLITFLAGSPRMHEKNKLLYLSSVLLWMIAFNHMSESPTAIIGATGIGLWFALDFTSQKWLKWTVFWVKILLMSVAYSDLTPQFIQDSFIYPYHIKAIPPVLVLGLIWGKLLFQAQQPRSS